MCLSRIGQIIYGALALLIIALICASMFTTGWRKLEPNLNNEAIRLLKTGTMNVGLFSVFCSNSFENTTATSKTNSATTDELLDQCTNWFMKELPMWNKAVVTAMILALLVAILAFVWNLLTFSACFCQAHIAKPLPGFAGMTGVLLLIALIVFCSNNEIADIRDKNITNIAELRNFVQGLDRGNDRVGYSFYLGCGAATASFVNMAVGIFVTGLAGKCL